MTPENRIRTYSDMVYRIAFARAGTKEDADDIYQEVFLRYIRKTPEFRDEEHAKAWFIKVAVNCSRKFLGGAPRKREASGEWVTETETETNLTGNGENGSTQTPEERFFADESKAELYRELQTLSADARLLLHLYYFEEMKTGEIAKLMHRKESTVRVQLKRAREKLKAQLEEDYAWSLYECLSRCFSDRFRKGKSGHEEFLFELEQCVEQLDTENAFQRACAQGVQWFMDDLKSEKKMKVLSIPVHDFFDTDGDGDLYEWIGDSYVVVYPEDWKKEYEENGTTEFMVEAKGGMPRTYLIEVKDFGSWSAIYRDMSVNYSEFEELRLGE